MKCKALQRDLGGHQIINMIAAKTPTNIESLILVDAQKKPKNFVQRYLYSLAAVEATPQLDQVPL